MIGVLASATELADHEDAKYAQLVKQIILPTAFTLLLCNMDRIVMSIAILPIAREFHWSPSTQV